MNLPAWCSTNGRSTTEEIRGVLRYKWKVHGTAKYKAWPVFPILQCTEDERYCTAIAVHIGGVMQYKAEVHYSIFSRAVGVGVAEIVLTLLPKMIFGAYPWCKIYKNVPGHQKAHENARTEPYSLWPRHAFN